MIARHETTANQASWLIIELSRYPLVVAKIRAEQDVLFQAGTVVDFTPQTLSTVLLNHGHQGRHATLGGDPSRL
jgi:cytochrome P450